MNSIFPRGSSRDCVIRIPSVSQKATKWAVSWNKGWLRVSAWMGTLKNLTKSIWRWEPDRGLNFLFQSACTSMCRHIYDWNIVACDVKQPFSIINGFGYCHRACLPNIKYLWKSVTIVVASVECFRIIGQCTKQFLALLCFLVWISILY